MSDRLGDYQLIARIGAGGMGEVWRAENIHTRVACALKLLPETAAADQNFVSRFFDEGRLMQTLEHPHIVRVHHVGHDEKSNRYYLVMDLIESDSGQSCSLHDLLAEAPDNRLPESDVRRWSLQIAEALAHAHAQGVVHRDIKPANVLIDREGNARVTDFGLAKAIGEEYLRSQIHTSIAQSMAGRSMGSLRTAKPEAKSPDAERSMGELPTMDTSKKSSSSSHGRTTADALLGTYDYMAPEQRGDLATPVSPATDVYAFGVMLYRLLTGRRPAGKAKDPSKLVKGISKHWDRITDRCLEHQPADRYADGAALKRDLSGVAGKSHPWRWAAALLLLLAAGGGYWAYQSQQQAPATLSLDVPGAVTEKQPIQQVDTADMAQELEPIEAALSAGDLAQADRKLDAARSRVPDSAHVQALSDRLDRAWRDEAQAARAAADRLWREAATLSREDGFGTLLDEIGTALNAATQQFDARDFRAAKPAYLHVRSQLETLLAQDAERTRAVDERNRAETARAQAQGRNAADLAAADWTAAENTRAEARTAFEQRRFGDSLTHWRAAAAGYAQSEQTATRVGAQKQAAGQAREAATAARRQAEAAQAEADGADQWAEAQRAMQQAQAHYVENRFEQAQAQWREAASAFERAERAAKATQAQRQREADAEAERRAAEERTRQNRPQEGRDWSLSSLGLTLKWIPAGTFRMGSTKAERDWAVGPEGQGEASWYTGERDPVEVRIARGFWLGQTTITRAMFRRFVEAENYRTEAERDGKAWTLDANYSSWGMQDGKSWRDPGFEQADDHPVVSITWNDAKAFCDWLTRTERAAGRLPDGYEYRLPGEAEWEYAARGGRRDSTKFWWGDSLSDGRGRLNGVGTDRLPTGAQWANRYDWDDGFAFTSPVEHYGARGRNGFGLADMLGNVWEWCYDGYDSNGPHSTIWQGDTSRRVLRGGSFGFQPGSLRCAGRGWNLPSTPNADFGFRVGLGVVVR